jgi:Carboxypeptidase regulatory-like domain/Bacterial Ig-like domain (group 2)
MLSVGPFKWAARCRAVVVAGVAAGWLLEACAGSSPSTAAPTPVVSTQSAPKVVSVAVSGSAPFTGTTTQFSATATSSDDTTQSVTNAASWSSSNSSVASVSASGAVTGVAAGDADITATYQTISGKARVTVVRPAPGTFTIRGTLRDGTSGGILPKVLVQATDSTGTTRSAVTDASGAYVISGVSAGAITLTVAILSYEPMTLTASVSADTRVDLVLTRLVPTVASLAVDGTAPPVGATSQFTATAAMSDGSSQRATTLATWTTSNASVATVNSAGLVRGVGPGDTAITASYLGASGSRRISIGAQAPTPSPAPSPPPAPSAPLNLTGTWTGSGSDGLGPETFTWVLTQSGSALSGSVSMRPPSLTDGTCGSCHKVKDGSISGSVTGTAITLRMSFALGGSQPTPTCLVIMDVSASGVTSTFLSSSYNGSDSCEPAVALGTITMTRR